MTATTIKNGIVAAPAAVGGIISNLYWLRKPRHIGGA